MIDKNMIEREYSVPDGGSVLIWRIDTGVLEIVVSDEMAASARVQKYVEAKALAIKLAEVVSGDVWGVSELYWTGGGEGTGFRAVVTTVP